MRSISAAMVVLALIGCGTGSPTDSGDTDGNGDGNSTDDSCSSNDDCASTKICISSSCVLAAGRKYRVTIQNAILSEKKPDGTSWDAAGGLPDAKTQVFVDGEGVGETAEVSDTTTPSWNAYVDIEVYDTTDIIFRLIDVDVTSDDAIGDIRIADPIGFVRAGSASTVSSTGAIRYFSTTVQPR